MARWWKKDIKEKPIGLLVVKNMWNENSLEGITTILSTAEEMINECEGVATGISQREAQKKRRIKALNRASEPMGQQVV